MPNHYTTVYFDWGGVMAADPGDDFLSALLTSLGATHDQIASINQAYLKQFMRGHITETDFWAALRHNYGLTIPGAISEEFTKWPGCKASQEVLALVTAVQASGRTVALLSNMLLPTFNILTATGYLAHFDHVIASCQVGYAKPEPEIYQIALHKAGAKPAESLVIDDKAPMLEPAAKLGFTTILARNPAQIVHDVTATLNL